MFIQAWETRVYVRWAAKSAGVFALCALVTATWFGFVAESTVAQDDDPPTLALTDIDDPAFDSMSETTRLIIRTVRDSSPQTPEKLAKAVRIMMDIELFQDARYYLSRLEKSGLSDAELFELDESIGSDFFLAIQLTPGVQPEGSRFAKKVMTATGKVAIEPSRLDRLIKTLSQPDITVRSLAFQRLRRLGEPAVAEMVNVFGDADRIAEYPGVRGALKHMGPDAQGPLLGASRASDLQVQTEAIRALGNFSTSQSLDVMLRTYLSPNAPEFLKKIAIDAITRSGDSADPAEVEKRLFDRSMDYLTGKRQAPGHLLGKSTLWDWDPTEKRMTRHEMLPATAARIIAFQNASDLFEIHPDHGRNRELYVLSQLEAAKRIVGSGSTVDVDGLVERFTLTTPEVESVLVQAMKLELIPASIACCEILNQIGDGSLVIGELGHPRPLVQAILMGDRHLQFAAFEAISKLDSPTGFPGSSYVFELAVFIAQSENQAAGVIGHNNQATAQTYAATLESSGIRGLSATSSRELFRIATNNPDVDVLMVSDTLDLPDYAELIQQLQNDWRTRRIPIAFLFRDVDRSRRVDTRVGHEGGYISVPFTLDPRLIHSNVTRLQSMTKPFELTNVDRRRHAVTAIAWLAQIANDRQRYRYIDLGARQSELVRLLYLPGMSEDASSILAKLGTPDAQRELVNFASQNANPMIERQRAVDAFSRSVKVGGTLLTTVEIQQQYDRYNASEQESLETQKVLGSILDVIEARRAAIGR